MFRALLTMKFSSSSESESCTLFWGRGSDAGLLLVFLVGKVMAILTPVVLRPRAAGLQFTFWNKRKQIVMIWGRSNNNKCPVRVHWHPYHGFHLPVDHALLQPAACILLLRHRWLLRCPPCLSWAVLLNRHRPQLQMVPACTPTVYKSHCVCHLPCWQSRHQSQSCHSCHRMKRRRSPWVWAWSCESSSSPSW